MKQKNIIGMTVIASGMLAMASCTDYSDYNSVPWDSNPSANETLFENISENKDLKQFAAIVKKANYANVLNSSQSFTLWAPADGTYDANAILAMDSADIVDKFIKQHMAEYSYPALSGDNKRVITLNDKHHDFSADSFDGFAIKEANIPSTNGLMHIIEGQSMFYPNIYENLSNVKGADKFIEYIQTYDTLVIDKRKSIEGPMLNGQKTYIDTVWTKKNDIIKNILRADIENEDSTYTVLFPTDEAWDNARAAIKPYFNYIPELNFMDLVANDNSTVASSLKAETAKSPKPVSVNAEFRSDSLSSYMVARNLAFSNNDPYNAPLIGQASEPAKADTVRTATRQKLSGADYILSHLSPSEPMSNGYIRGIDTICFRPDETYCSASMVTSPLRVLALGAGKSETYNAVSIKEFVGRDSLFDNVPEFLKEIMLPEGARYFNYVSVDSTSMSGPSAKPELAFTLPSILSTKYHIYVTFVPKQLLDPETQSNKDLYVRFDLSYTDAAGKQQIKRINVPTAAKNSDDIIISGGKLSVVELEFEFPICYYGLTATTADGKQTYRVGPTLFISNTKSFTSSGNRAKYEQELRVHSVVCVPDDVMKYYTK